MWKGEQICVHVRFNYFAQVEELNLLQPWIDGDLTY